MCGTPQRQPIWQANAQDARGHVTQEQYGNGQDANHRHKPDQRQAVFHRWVQLGRHRNLTYWRWDAVGNLICRADNGQSIGETFVYDDLYRVRFGKA